MRCKPFVRVVSRPRAWCLATLLASLVFSSPTRAEIYFEDDFDSPEYIDQFGLPSDIGVQDEGGWLFVDENMPVETSTWTITNPGGRGNPPTADGRVRKAACWAERMAWASLCRESANCPASAL